MELALFLLTGACTGILSGMLGIGGGLIIVPVLLVLLASHPFPPQHLMHVALGTSLATIVFTSMASARSHHRHGHVDWKIVRHITPGILLGTLAGAWLASQMHTDWLKILFAIFVFYVGTQMLLDLRPPVGRTLPGQALVAATGGLIGLVSSLVGIGGGTLTVPFLLFCNHHMRHAVGTSAAVGLPIALGGTLGFILAGAGKAIMPPYTVGFVYLPAVAGITAASMLTAPLGVRLARTLPIPLLKKLFAILLYAVGLKMAWSIL